MGKWWYSRFIGKVTICYFFKCRLRGVIKYLGEHLSIRRGTWFDSSDMPLDEQLSDTIEHMHTIVQQAEPVIDPATNTTGTFRSQYTYIVKLRVFIYE